MLVKGSRLVYSIKDRIYAFQDGEHREVGRLSSRWSPCAFLPSLADRLLRNEISHYRTLGEGSEFAILRNRFFARRAGFEEFGEVHRLERGSRPLVISTENGLIAYGEYGTLPYNQPVHLYAASASDFKFERVHAFPAGTIKHVHGVIWDPHERCYWVTVGDSDGESGILRLSPCFGEAQWVVRGGQEARAVGLLVFERHIIYGMDSERAPNHIMHLDKTTGRVSKIRPLEGSCLHSARFAGGMAISTACEPSKVNFGRTSHLYVSHDGLDWKRVASRDKDRWSPRYFQFGTFVLPHCEDAEFLAYGGQALTGAHGWCAILPPGI